MKVIYAGHNVPITNIRNYLFACQRELNDLEYYIPCATMEDVQVYVEFGKKPYGFSIDLYNLCNDTFSPIAPDNYVIGKNPNGKWYGVFTFNNTVIPPPVFALAFTFVLGFVPGYIYFSQAYQVNQCRSLTKIEACFPIKRTDEFGLDSNDIYFGSTTDQFSLGDITLSYKHYAFVRRAKVFKDPPKLIFTSNSRRNFRTKIDRIYELRSELVPDWYKEYLLAIYSRGFITVDGIIYRVTDLAFEGMNENDRTWKPYVKLLKEREFQFSCDDCTPLVLPCLNDIVQDEYFIDENGLFVQLFLGALPQGNILEWQIYSKDDMLLVSGSILQPPLQIATDFGIDPSLNCYKLKWMVRCSTGAYSVWKESVGTFGDCNEGIVPIVGTINMIPTGNNNQGGPIKMVIDFAQPTPGVIQYRAGFDRIITGGGFSNTSQGYDAPYTFPVSRWDGGFNASNQNPPAIIQTIPAGTTHYEKLSTLSEPGASYGYVSKGIFHGLVLPAGYSIQLTPTRPNLAIEIR